MMSVPTAGRNGSSDQKQRRILSIDGGGLRGLIALGILAEVERVFRRSQGQSDLRLCDVFDLIAGTSTGAIVAACLSWGMTVEEIIRLYRDNAKAMFSKTPWLQRFRAKYRADQVGEKLRARFTEDDGTVATLGSQRLQSLLLVVLRNGTTGAPWPITNNPRAMFNDRSRTDCNLDIPLWQLVRASAAAPVFYAPEEIQLGRQKFTFVDGGVSPHNNPAMIALLTATLPEYRVRWPVGPDRLHLLSIGTGRSRAMLRDKPVRKYNILDHAAYAPKALIAANMDYQDMLCRILGRTIVGDPLDREVGALMNEGPIGDDNRLCSYIRYNPTLDHFLPMDDVSQIDRYQQIGEDYAEVHVSGEHLGE